ncbi:DDE transposase family protein [Thermus scotoductus]|uniref:DDE transposase family protein n=4 Tax=Thermus TaxID=270 RepID=A0A430SED3_THESC|nr:MULTISPECIES: transposase family protein [Thermus]QWK22025.1 MAG: transposase family protein [Thermus antranikianii]RTH35531.1 DDE transposase family protein [Thermus scotoductus]
MTLREALAGIPDPRGKNRQFPLPGLLALILVAFLCRVDSLRGVARFARANPHLLPHLGLRRPPGHYALTTLLHRLDPWDLQEALARVFPEVPVSPGEREVWVVDGKVLRGSRKGGFPQVRLVEVLALGLRRTLVQARAEGREARALMEVLGRLGAEGLEGRLVVGDAGYVYPEVARGIGEKGGRTCWR